MRCSTSVVSRARDSAEMARLAEQLGLAFQARAFLTIAAAVHPERDELRRERARLDRREETLFRAGRTLADLLAVENPCRRPIPPLRRPRSRSPAGLIVPASRPGAVTCGSACRKIDAR